MLNKYLGNEWMKVRKGAGNKKMEGEEVRRKGKMERCGETLAEQEE